MTRYRALSLPTDTPPYTLEIPAVRELIAARAPTERLPWTGIKARCLAYGFYLEVNREHDRIALFDVRLMPRDYRLTKAYLRRRFGTSGAWGREA